MALFSTISWCLWQRRNRLRENQPTWPLNEVGERAMGLVHEFFEAGKSEAVPRVAAVLVHWCCPPNGFYKVNIDAALFENLGCTRFGWCDNCCIVSTDPSSSVSGDG